MADNDDLAYVLGEQSEEQLKPTERIVFQEEEGTTFISSADPTDYLFNRKNLAITIQHIPTGHTVRFKALVKTFSDSFESSWNSEEVYGRMDPIQTFQGTKRIITLEWDVVSYDLKEAKRNLKSTDLLTNFLYPVYSEGDATSITAAPLLRVKLANLISHPNFANKGASDEEGIAASGLVARMDGFSYTPDFDAGVFFEGNTNVTMYPQTISIQATFHILHTNKLGWAQGDDKETRNPQGGFPHGSMPAKLGKTKKPKETPAATAQQQDALAAQILKPAPGSYDDSIFDKGVGEPIIPASDSAASLLNSDDTGVLLPKSRTDRERIDQAIDELLGD